MRTTIDIDDDVLQAVREIAAREGISMGKALSILARQTLTIPAVTGVRNGVPLFPSKDNAGIITLELVNRLRDETL